MIKRHQFEPNYLGQFIVIGISEKPTGRYMRKVGPQTVEEHPPIPFRRVVAVRAKLSKRPVNRHVNFDQIRQANRIFKSSLRSKLTTKFLKATVFPRSQFCVLESVFVVVT